MPEWVAETFSPPVRGTTNIEMKLAVITTTFGLALAMCAGAAEGTAPAKPAADSGPVKTPKEKNSYMLGMNLGKQLKQNYVDLDYDVYMRGLKDAIGGKELLNEEQFREAMMAFQQDVREKMMAKRKAEADKAKKAGEDFLAENKKKEGIVTTDSGLQYKVETKGTGKKPTTGDTVVCHYRGTLIDGTEFDSSYKRGQPAEFPVTGVIKGWTEALQLMPVGSKWKLFIPSNLAYGENGSPPKIAGGAALIFDIELIDIKPTPPPAALGTPTLPATPGNPGTAPAAQPKK
jgi:FKBP-type peptidyl-prolyl cis-trans isomerase FklB